MVKRAKAEESVVLTIGHSTHAWEDFLKLLRAHGVERVVDVRSIPRSRNNPQFNRDTLSKKLRAARIGYVHMRKLGGLRRTHRGSVNMGWRNTSFRGFADYMQSSEFLAGLERLIKLAAQKRSAIMCAEAVPWRCHRSLIADALTVRGIRVDDIMSGKRADSFAHFFCVCARTGHPLYWLCQRDQKAGAPCLFDDAAVRVRERGSGHERLVLPLSRATKSLLAALPA